jgi:hypothetical protein
VFRLIRWLASLALLGGFIWFGMMVPLGRKTLFEHLRAIGTSKEAHDLVEGTKQATRPVLERATHRLSHDGGVRDGGAAASDPSAGHATQSVAAEPREPAGRPRREARKHLKKPAE